MLSTVYGLWGCCGRFGRPRGTFWKVLAPLVRGASSLGCVCSRKVPVHPAESLATLCYKSAPTLQILRMVSAQEDMFVCMRTTARGAARRGSSRRPRFRKVKRSRQGHRLVETDPLSLTSFLSNTNAQAGAGGHGPLTEVMSHFLPVLCLGLQYDA